MDDDNLTQRTPDPSVDLERFEGGEKITLHTHSVHVKAGHSVSIPMIIESPLQVSYLDTFITVSLEVDKGDIFCALDAQVATVDDNDKDTTEITLFEAGRVSNLHRGVIFTCDRSKAVLLLTLDNSYSWINDKFVKFNILINRPRRGINVRSAVSYLTEVRAIIDKSAKQMKESNEKCTGTINKLNEINASLAALMVQKEKLQQQLVWEHDIYESASNVVNENKTIYQEVLAETAITVAVRDGPLFEMLSVEDNIRACGVNRAWRDLFSYLLHEAHMSESRRNEVALLEMDNISVALASPIADEEHAFPPVVDEISTTLQSETPRPTVKVSKKKAADEEEPASKKDKEKAKGKREKQETKKVSSKSPSNVTKAKKSAQETEAAHAKVKKFRDNSSEEIVEQPPRIAKSKKEAKPEVAAASRSSVSPSSASMGKKDSVKESKKESKESKKSKKESEKDTKGDAKAKTKTEATKSTSSTITTSTTSATSSTKRKIAEASKEPLSPLPTRGAPATIPQPGSIFRRSQPSTPSPAPSPVASSKPEFGSGKANAGLSVIPAQANGTVSVVRDAIRMFHESRNDSDTESEADGEEAAMSDLESEHETYQDEESDAETEEEEESDSEDDNDESDEEDDDSDEESNSEDDSSDDSDSEDDSDA